MNLNNYRKGTSMEKNIYENLKKIRKEISKNVTLVAVSKTKPQEDILEAYSAGQRIFGENKILEMSAKYEELPKDIEWHMIGHVQRNKVKYMASFVSLIHAVESENLLKEINKRALQNDRVIDCLLQIHIADEQTKFGFSYQEVEDLISSKVYKKYENIRLVGFMGMATNTDDKDKVSLEFEMLNTFFCKMKDVDDNFKILSMGMSGDYKIAMEKGSNMIRVGSYIFGERNYTKK